MAQPHCQRQEQESSKRRNNKPASLAFHHVSCKACKNFSPFSPPPLRWEQPPPSVPTQDHFPQKSGLKRKSCLLAPMTGTHRAPHYGEWGAGAPQANQATRPHPAKGHPGEKSRRRWQHKAGPEGSGAVIYPNPAQGGEGSSGGMRHLAVPGRRCGNAVRTPSPGRPAGLPFSRGRKGTIAIQGLPGSRPPQIRAV